MPSTPQLIFWAEAIVNTYLALQMVFLPHVTLDTCLDSSVKPTPSMIQLTQLMGGLELVISLQLLAGTGSSPFALHARKLVFGTMLFGDIFLPTFLFAKSVDGGSPVAFDKAWMRNTGTVSACLGVFRAWSFAYHPEWYNPRETAETASKSR